MFGKSLIDDVKPPSSRSQDGYPILFSNANIRQMLKLANVGKNDVFFDLGSGWGQNGLLALTEFRVKKAVGIEGNMNRWRKSSNRLLRWKRHYAPFELNGRFILADYDDFFFDGQKTPEIKGESLKEATAIFYGLGTSRDLARQLGKTLSMGCRLLYYYDCVFPEFLPMKRCFHSTIYEANK